MSVKGFISDYNWDAASLPDGLIETGGDNEVLRGVELGAHDVMVVSGQDGHAVARLPVPDTHSLTNKKVVDTYENSERVIGF